MELDKQPIDNDDARKAKVEMLSVLNHEYQTSKESPPQSQRATLCLPLVGDNTYT